MILLIGNNFVVRRASCVVRKRNTHHAIRNTRKGVTLVEVMISVSILSIGLVLVLQAFAYCLNGLRISENNLKASLLAGNKMAQAQIQAKEDWDTFENGLSERFNVERLKCTWDIEINPVEWEVEEEVSSSYDDLNELRANFAWKEGRRKGMISLVTYMRSSNETE